VRIIYVQEGEKVLEIGFGGIVFYLWLDQLGILEGYMGSTSQKEC
jgi:hypothetical protein